MEGLLSTGPTPSSFYIFIGKIACTHIAHTLILRVVITSTEKLYFRGLTFKKGLNIESSFETLMPFCTAKYTGCLTLFDLLIPEGLEEN